MAKPIPTGRAGCSSPSPSYLRPDSLHSHIRPRRRRRPPASTGPSPAVLSLLAIISTSSSVYGSPAPPSFLCPSFDVGSTTRNPYSRGSLTRKIRRAPLSTNSAGNTRHVPNKFEMDDNGRWRRVESYTLYGSTVCLTCQDATTSVPSVNDQIQGSASSSVPQPTPSATKHNIDDDLPPGWKPAVATGGSRTTLILALSLVLAFVICFLIIACLFWRKTKRRKRKPNDVDIEMKARKRRRGRSADDGRESMLALEREVKVKQKIWARATARWKANARYTARQRRGKRIASTTKIGSPQSSCASLDIIEDARIALHISTCSPIPTRRSSLESLYTGTSPGNATTTTPSLQDETQAGSIPLVPLSSTPPSPPAYHLRISVPQVSSLSDVQVVGDVGGDRQLTSLSMLPNGSQYASSSNFRPSDPSDTPRDMDFPSQRIHAAHVATDDKALLARLADLASAPPPDCANPSQATFHASVPIWQDEDPEYFKDAPYNLAHCSLPPSRLSSGSSSPAPLFPPPPSKGKMAAPSFYDYPYSFEDISVEPDPGPSAPPFEEEPGCPLDLPKLTPSAPPFSDTAASYYFETYASAPTHDWETAPPPVTSDSGDAIEQSQDIIPACDGTDSRPCRPSADSIPLVHGPVASDGTPPSYQP